MLCALQEHGLRYVLSRAPCLSEVSCLGITAGTSSHRAARHAASRVGAGGTCIARSVAERHIAPRAIADRDGEAEELHGVQGLVEDEPAECDAGERCGEAEQGRGCGWASDVCR